MAIASVALPGPWWTMLSYTCRLEPAECLRVRVPLGRSLRVGITARRASDDNYAASGELKEVADVIDSAPAMPDELWKTIKWFGRTWFTGVGMSAKTLLPAKFFAGEAVPPAPMQPQRASALNDGVDCLYEPRDRERCMRYAEILEAAPRGAMALFPEMPAAKKFWELLPDALKNRGMLYPASNPSKQWELWKIAREGGVEFIVGSQAAAFLPLAGLSLIIVDDESSGSWLTQKHPLFHMRSLLAARASFAGAGLLLGGRMPSAKAFMRCKDASGTENIQGRTILVDLHDSSACDVEGVSDTLPISRPLLRETKACRAEGRWALWLLDRKGYAGEIFCADCGASVRCPECGGAMRWEASSERLACLNCSHRMAVPDVCPSCGGHFLHGVRPGAEALYDRASSLLKYTCGPVISFRDDEKLPSAAKLKEEYPSGAVITGTRRILSFEDDLRVGVAGWIDSDGEARGMSCDAKARAFGLLWESAWRGLDPDARRVVIQSRRPGKGWQAGLLRGWRSFWDGELKYRRDFELPPFAPLVDIQMPRGRGAKLEHLLDGGEFEYMESDDSSDRIIVRTRQFDRLRSIIAPFFEIANTRLGIPKVTLTLE